MSLTIDGGPDSDRDTSGNTKSILCLTYRLYSVLWEVSSGRSPCPSNPFEMN